MQTFANASSKKNASLRVGVIGATGAVGQEIVKCLERRRFPVRELRLLAGTRSAGSRSTFGVNAKSSRSLQPTALTDWTWFCRPRAARWL